MNVRVQLFPEFDGNTTELIWFYGCDIKLNFEEFVFATETERIYPKKF